MKKKYLIEFIKQYGKPHTQTVTELGENDKLTKNRGYCMNIDEVPGFKEFKEQSDKFEFVHEGEFETHYRWQDYRNVWHPCNKSKFDWCNENGKTTELTLTFKS